MYIIVSCCCSLLSLLLVVGVFVNVACACLLCVGVVWFRCLLCLSVFVVDYGLSLMCGGFCLLFDVVFVHRCGLLLLALAGVVCRLAVVCCWSLYFFLVVAC